MKIIFLYEPFHLAFPPQHTVYRHIIDYIFHPLGPFLDGALVLGHSCLEAQKETGAYTAELVAFVTPGVVKAREVLANHGWIIIEQDLPVTLEEITNPVYVKKVNLGNDE